MPQGLGPTNRYVLAGHHVTSHMQAGLPLHPPLSRALPCTRLAHKTALSITLHDFFISLQCV